MVEKYYKYLMTFRIQTRVYIAFKRMLRPDLVAYHRRIWIKPSFQMLASL